MLDGTITFTSEENKGTTFIVTIPLNKTMPDYE
jgi:signal transduction histidine kinase